MLLVEVGQWDRHLVRNVFLAYLRFWNVFLVYLCGAYLGNSFEVKIEAASNDITECPCDDKPSIGTLFFYTSTNITPKCLCNLISQQLRNLARQTFG